MSESSNKRSSGPLSGMRGVVIGAGLGVLAAKKVPPLLQKVGPAVQNAMLKYVMSHGAGAAGQVAQGATDQVAQGAAGQVAQGAAGQVAQGATDQVAQGAAGQAAQGATGQVPAADQAAAGSPAA